MGLFSRKAPVSIAFIPRIVGNPYFNSLIEGFNAGCRLLECPFTVSAPTSSDARSQLPLMAAQIERKVEVIAIAPNSLTALNELFDEARSKGILVLTVNSDVVGYENRRDAAVLPVDFSKVGAAQVELLGSQIDYEGEIAILSTTEDAPDQNAWIADMKRTVASVPRYARMRVVAVAYGKDDPKQSAIEVTTLLERYPRLKGILAPTVVGLPAAASAVALAGKSASVRVTGLGTPNQMRSFVQNGQVPAFHLCHPYNAGLLAAHFAKAVKHGRLQNKPGKSFNVPSLGKITIQERNVIFPVSDLTTFDRSNVDRYNF